jgi:CelD/BcsL family acetyltransferase involved in cellulose biosynthesis
VSGELVTVDPLREPEWSKLVARAPEATAFHDPAWLRLLKEHYRYEVFAWCLADGGGRLVAGLPVARVQSRLTGERLVALPFSDACGPLLDPGTLADAVAAGQERAGLPLEVRADLGTGVVTTRYLRHLLPLESGVEARFKPQVRRGIAKAIREGVEVERRTGEDALRRFYALHTATRKRQGVPTQPRRFIMRFTELFAAGHGFVLLATQGGRDIAAAVFLSGGRTLTYKYGASRRADLHLRPNNLLFREAIRWGLEDGLAQLDFGRTDLDNEGLAAFKRSFGAIESPLAYSYLGAPLREPGRGLAGRALTTVIQHSPAGVGRFVGEALYRDFA